jgi:hypothetical protein
VQRGRIAIVDRSENLAQPLGYLSPNKSNGISPGELTILANSG